MLILVLLIGEIFGNYLTQARCNKLLTTNDVTTAVAIFR